MLLLSARRFFRSAPVRILSSQNLHRYRVTQFSNLKAVRNMSEQNTDKKSAATGLSHQNQFVLTHTHTHTCVCVVCCVCVCVCVSFSSAVRK